MSQNRRLAVFNSIVESGLIPIYYHDEVTIARQIMEACVLGGAKVIEFTNRGDKAWRTFLSLLEHRQNNQLEVMLGAGSIIEAVTAALYINNGADFIVGPTFNRDIAELCNRRKVAYIPGCGTLTEIAEAEAMGAELVKIFPGDVLGPEFIKAVHGPMPWTMMMVTGGVSPDQGNINKWFNAGVTAVGMGSKLIRREWVATGQYQELSEIVSLTLKWIHSARSP